MKTNQLILTKAISDGTVTELLDGYGTDHILEAAKRAGGL